MKMRSPLARVRGLGSAKEGLRHWRMQRLTAVALIPLSLWFVASIIACAHADYRSVVEWLSSPLAAVLMLALIWALFYHAKLGIQVVFEDYVHTEWLKFACLIALKFAVVLLGLASTIAVLKIAVGAH